MIDGVRFASKAEARRYCELRLLEKAGEIRELELQPKFPLYAFCGGCVGHYIADFRYRAGTRGVLIIEDVKGVKTAMYRWKKKHFELQYGLQITEI